MKIQAVKGTRDFYPPEMRLRNWIIDTWRKVSVRNGFEEYDSPIFEYLDLFTIKSGQEIAEQLFSFEDRGGRKLAIRPEITPALARMVNARINALPRPIKWFSVPRLCRAENPQKGRLREFFQWNIDVIGSDDVLADAECIMVCVDFLREIGLSPQDVQVRIGSRPLTVAMLNSLGVQAPDMVDKILVVLDKRPKVDQAEFARLCQAAGLSVDQVRQICAFQDSAAPQSIAGNPLLKGLDKEIADLRRLFEYLTSMGVAEYCRCDMRIVRGLAYYTGIVYEVFDIGQSLRALAGGGRYDNLLEVLGGPKMGACGFGMGDVVLGILLQEKDKVHPSAQNVTLDFFVVDETPDQLDRAIQVVAALRAKGRSADFNYKRQAIGKQLKEANRRGAVKAVIVRADGELAIKDLVTGTQEELSQAEFLAPL